MSSFVKEAEKGMLVSNLKFGDIADVVIAGKTHVVFISKQRVSGRKSPGPLKATSLSTGEEWPRFKCSLKDPSNYVIRVRKPGDVLEIV